MRRLAALLVLAAAAVALPAAAAGPDMHFHGKPAAMHVHGHPAARVLADGMYHHS